MVTPYLQTRVNYLPLFSAAACVSGGLEGTSPLINRRVLSLSLLPQSMPKRREMAGYSVTTSSIFYAKLVGSCRWDATNGRDCCGHGT
jgi:hypothetical protein